MGCFDDQGIPGLNLLKVSAGGEMEEQSGLIVPARGPLPLRYTNICIDKHIDIYIYDT